MTILMYTTRQNVISIYLTHMRGSFVEEQEFQVELLMHFTFM